MRAGDPRQMKGVPHYIFSDGSFRVSESKVYDMHDYFIRNPARKVIPRGS
jgi:hypothetical protein